MVGDEKLILQMKSLADRRARCAARASADRSRPRAKPVRSRHHSARAARRGAHGFQRRDEFPARLVAERAVIEQQLAEGDVLAPTSGRVLKVPVTPGTVVLPGEPVA